MAGTTTPGSESEFTGFGSSTPRTNPAGDPPAEEGEGAVGEEAAEEDTAASDDDAELRDLEDEVNQLQKKERIKALKAEAARLRSGAGGAAIIAGPSSALPAGGASAPQAATVVKAKTLKPDPLPPYHGRSDGEYRKFSADANLAFLKSPDYFPHDTSKILHCMTALRDDPQIQWQQRSANGSKLEGVTFDYFMEFLLRLIADPVNRRLNSYEKWEEAKQMPNQKVTVFKAYLEELESQLEPFEETHRAFIFLAKLRPNLKEKILGTGQVPETREGMLGVAVMQEKNLERARGGSGSNPSSNPNQDQNSTKPKKPKGNKPQQQQQPRQDNNQPGRGRQKKEQASNKRPRDVSNANATPVDMSKVQCYGCGKYGHYKSQCPDEKQSVGAVLGEVSDSKNEGAPQARRKRGKKDQ